MWVIFAFELLNYYDEFQYPWLFRTINLIDLFLSTIPLILFFCLFFFTRAGAVAGKADS